MSDSLRPHELQHARPPCPLRSLVVYKHGKCPWGQNAGEPLTWSSFLSLPSPSPYPPSPSKKKINQGSVSLVAPVVSECKNLLAGQEAWVQALGWEGRLQKWKPTPVFLPGRCYGQRSLVGYSQGGHEESDTTEQTSFSFSQF